MSADVVAARLAEVAARHGLANPQCEQLCRLLEILEHDERAPTAIRSAALAVDAHLADSLVSLELAVVRSAAVLADLGAGVGFPGLALAVACPAAEIRLVESAVKTCEFLERVCVEAELPNVRVVRSRVEDWRAGTGAHDVVVARALAAQPVVLEYAAPLLRLGGTLVDWRGARARGEEEGAARAAEQLGMRLARINRVEPFDGARNRHLHEFVKVAETPARFPRRAGMARKRPLGS
jgi:16S rRNA (guanine527-N7)-methyltransferase